MKDTFKHYIKSWLPPVLIAAVPLWILVSHMWDIMYVEFELDGGFSLVTKIIFYIFLLLFFSQYLRLISFMFGVDVIENGVEKLLQQGKGLVDQWTRMLHAKILAQFVISTILKVKNKKHRKLARPIFFEAAIKMSGSLTNSRELSRCALNYLLARAAIGFCFSHSFKLLIELVAELVNHQPVLIEKYVVFFVVYGVPLLFSRKILRSLGFRYARKFWELFDKPDKSSRSKQLENNRDN